MEPLDADWLVLRLHGAVYTFPEDEYRRWLLKLLGPGSGYGVYRRMNSSVVVLKHGHSPDANPETLRELLRVVEEEDALHPGNIVVRDRAALNGRAVFSSGADEDFIWWGAYRDLPAGRYRARFRLWTEAETNAPIVRLDVVEQKGRHSCGSLEITGSTGGYAWKSLEANLSGQGDAEARCYKIGKGTIRVDRAEWEPLEITDNKGASCKTPAAGVEAGPPLPTIGDCDGFLEGRVPPRPSFREFCKRLKDPLPAPPS
jgi:hypothetical protein